MKMLSSVFTASAVFPMKNTSLVRTKFKVKGTYVKWLSKYVLLITAYFIYTYLVNDLQYYILNY